MPNKRTFTFINDPAHAWLQVTQADLSKLGIIAERTFSDYSFRSPDMTMYYLEEDCDAPKFLRLWTETFGAPIVAEQYHDGPAPCRNLPRIQTVT